MVFNTACRNSVNVMKKGRKSAVKLHGTQAAADKHVIEIAKPGHSIDFRPGEFHRCMEYCNVAHACPAMKTSVGF